MPFSPIRLTPFEWMMLEDGGQPTPMTYRIRLVLSGEFDPDVFVSAVNRTILHHPLLCAHINGANGKNLMWVPAQNPIPYLDMADRATACHFPGSERINLREETGLRIWVRYADRSTEVRFQFHHACCDGTGAYRLIEDILCAYDSILNEPSAEVSFRPIDLTTLTKRDRFSVNAFPLPSRVWRHCIVHPLRVGRFVVERPDPIHHCGGLGSAQKSDTLLLDMPSHTFTKSETRSLRHVAAAAQATTNELLLRDLFLTIDEWNQRTESNDRRKTLRILVPISLRTKAEDEMPAANVMSLVAVTGRPHSLDNPPRLLVDVVREMAFIRRWRVDLFWHEEAWLVCALPVIVSFLRRTASDCYLSSALTNMGKLFARAQLPRQAGKIQAGGLTLETVDGAPPVSSFAATFACHWYAGKLVLAMNYDRHRLGSTEAGDLMASYVRRLNDTAEAHR